MPGSTAKMDPRPAQTSFKGSGPLQGKRAIITGGESDIRRTVAIAFAREGPDILIAALTQKKGSKTALADGDLRLADDRRAVVDRAVREFGGVAILESYRGRKCKAA